MIQDAPEPAVKLQASTLADDMRLVLEDTSTTDVTFLVGEASVPIHAHKSIVKARSQYFNALLSGGFSETGEHEVRLPDASPETFPYILEYLYCGKIENIPPSLVVELMHFASRYCLDGLVALCEVHLRNCVNVENVAQVMHISQDSHARQLKRYCTFYARKNSRKLIGELWHSAHAQQLS